MSNIRISREHTDVRAVVYPDDQSWQLIVDNDGIPHLSVKVSYEVAPGSPECARGWMPVEAVFADGITMKSLVAERAFVAPATDEEEAAMVKQWEEEGPWGPEGPCPKPLPQPKRS